MTGTIIFVLLVLTTGLSATSALAEAEIPSPLKQFQQGIPIEETQCRDARTLMSSPSGRPACVYDISVSILEQRGFIKVATTDRAELKTGDEQTTFTYHNNKPRYGGHSSIGPTASIPIYTIGIPTSTIAVGETVSMPYTISWVHPNGTLVIDAGDRTDQLFTTVVVMVSDEFTVLNEDKQFIWKYADRYDNHTATAYVIIKTYSDDPISGSIDVRLERPLLHDFDIFQVGIWDFSHNLIAQKTDTGLTLAERDSFTDPLDVHAIKAMSNAATGPDGRYDRVYTEDVPHMPETRSVRQASELPSQENKYIPKVGWGVFAEYLRHEMQYSNITDARSWMLERNLTEEFVNDFLAEYPEFVITRTGFDSSLRAHPDPVLLAHGKKVSSPIPL